MKYLEIDCENREEIASIHRLIKESGATVVSEKTTEGKSFSHIIWVTGSDEALYQVFSYYEPGSSLEEAMSIIDSDTRRYHENHTSGF